MILKLPGLSSGSNIRSKNLNNGFCSKHRAENGLQSKSDIAFGDIWRHFRLHHVALRDIFRNWLILHCGLFFWSSIEHKQEVTGRFSFKFSYSKKSLSVWRFSQNHLKTITEIFRSIFLAKSEWAELVKLIFWAQVASDMDRTSSNWKWNFKDDLWRSNFTEVVYDSQ